MAHHAGEARLTRGLGGSRGQQRRRLCGWNRCGKLHGIHHVQHPRVSHTLRPDLPQREGRRPVLVSNRSPAATLQPVLTCQGLPTTIGRMRPAIYCECRRGRLPYGRHEVAHASRHHALMMALEGKLYLAPVSKDIKVQYRRPRHLAQRLVLTRRCRKQSTSGLGRVCLAHRCPVSPLN